MGRTRKEQAHPDAQPRRHPVRQQPGIVVSSWNRGVRHRKRAKISKWFYYSNPRNNRIAEVGRAQAGDSKGSDSSWNSDSITQIRIFGLQRGKLSFWVHPVRAQLLLTRGRLSLTLQRRWLPFSPAKKAYQRRVSTHARPAAQPLDQVHHKTHRAFTRFEHNPEKDPLPLHQALPILR